MLKRKKLNSPLEELNSPFKTAHFLEMRHSDPSKTLTSVSPFLIEKSLTAAIKGNLKSVKKLKSGAILIETTSFEQNRALQNLTSLGNIVPVIVQPHASLNAGRGVIRCRELEGMPNEEICEALSAQGVIDVKRLTKANSNRSPTVYLLVFATVDVPKTVDILYQKYLVETYYPQPLRCFQCQTYGHGTPCSRPAICPKCAQLLTDSHTIEACTNPLRCAACKIDGHDVRSKTCPRYIEERQVIKISQTEQISVPAARKSVRNGQTYASIVSNSQNMFPLLPISPNKQTPLPVYKFAPKINEKTPHLFSIKTTPNLFSISQPSTAEKTKFPSLVHETTPTTDQAPVRKSNQAADTKCNNCEKLIPVITQLTAQVTALTNLVQTLLKQQFQPPKEVINPVKINKKNKKKANDKTDFTSTENFIKSLPMDTNTKSPTNNLTTQNDIPTELTPMAMESNTLETIEPNIIETIEPNVLETLEPQVSLTPIIEEQ